LDFAPTAMLMCTSAELQEQVLLWGIIMFKYIHSAVTCCCHFTGCSREEIVSDDTGQKVQW